MNYKKTVCHANRAKNNKFKSAKIAVKRRVMSLLYLRLSTFPLKMFKKT